MVKIVLELKEIEVPMIYIACEGSGNTFLAVGRSLGGWQIGERVNRLPAPLCRYLSG